MAAEECGTGNIEIAGERNDCFRKALKFAFCSVTCATRGVDLGGIFWADVVVEEIVEEVADYACIEFDESGSRGIEDTGEAGGAGEED